MWGTWKAYKDVMKHLWLWWLLLLLNGVGIFTVAVLVTKIEKEVQDALLTIMSILFPLIAGFLTFGRDMLKGVFENIDKITDKDIKKQGEPTTDKDKLKIKKLKEKSLNFIKIIESTFVISLAMIVFILISKFNNYFFDTDSIFSDKFDLKDMKNWFGIILKVLFFYLVNTISLNAVYLAHFIKYINKHDFKKKDDL